MQTSKQQQKQSAGESASVISSTDAASAAPTRASLALVHPQRDGAILMRELIDRYMMQYAGRDKMRAQRLGCAADELGHHALIALDEDHIPHWLEALAGSRGRSYAGKDADGARIFKAKHAPLKPATVN